MPSLPIRASLSFDLIDKIGGGGFGEVHLAFDRQLNANVAVKKIPIATFNNITEYFSESQKLYFTRHHNIVEIMYGCEDNGNVYLAMPFLAKGSIKGVLDSRFLSAREIIRYSLQFLSGLNNVHAKGLVHFDVKCENILLSDSNIALLSDFGLAQYTSHYGFCTNYGTTQVYAPPELFTKNMHNSLFDIYQSGLAMYRMCNGDRFFFDQLNKALNRNGAVDIPYFINNVSNGKFPDRAFFLPHIPKQLRRIITNCLAVDPGNRYSTVIEILNELSGITSANDWEFLTDYTTSEEWNNGSRKVIASLNGGLWEVNALKSGKYAHAYCGNGLSLKDKNVLIYKCLEEWS